MFMNDSIIIMIIHVLLLNTIIIFSPTHNKPASLLAKSRLALSEHSQIRCTSARQEPAFRISPAESPAALPENLPDPLCEQTELIPVLYQGITDITKGIKHMKKYILYYPNHNLYEKAARFSILTAFHSFVSD